jgi:hypothetical protein
MFFLIICIILGSHTYILYYNFNNNYNCTSDKEHLKQSFVKVDSSGYVGL